VADDRSVDVQHPTDQSPQRPCICGGTDHTAIDGGFSASGSGGVGFYRCPRREIPAPRRNDGLGVCWALDDDGEGLHCTEPPLHDGEHRNAYTGKQWRHAGMPQTRH
jgi:hypothetical protein